MEEDWSKIRPHIWTTPERRYYLYISPSGMTHIAYITGSADRGAPYDSALKTLCGKPFDDTERDRRRGWRRPFTEYYSGRISAPFMGVTCSICAKKVPTFEEPLFEVDLHPYGSHHDNDEVFLTYIIPSIIKSRRCDTCTILCSPWSFQRFQDKVKNARHEKHRYDYYPTCSLWSSNAYYRRQHALILTDTQMRQLPLDRLELIYTYLLDQPFSVINIGFMSRLLKAMKEYRQGVQITGER